MRKLICRLTDWADLKIRNIVLRGRNIDLELENRHLHLQNKAYEIENFEAGNKILALTSEKNTLLRAVNLNNMGASREKQKLK